MGGDDGMDLAGIGKRLRTFRRERQWKQVELARRAGVNKGTVSRVESGKRGASGETIRRLAGALDVSLDLLVTGEEATPPDAPQLAQVAHLAQLPAEEQYRALHELLDQPQARARLTPEKLERLKALIEGFIMGAQP